MTALHSKLTLVLVGMMLMAGCGDPDAPPPYRKVEDGGPPLSGAMGKLCHDLAEVSGAHITLKVEVGSTTLSASTLSCGACEPLPVGSGVAFRIFWPGAPTADNTLFEGTADIVEGEDWLFAVTKKDDTFEMLAGPLKDQYTCQTIDPFAP